MKPRGHLRKLKHAIGQGEVTTSRRGVPYLLISVDPWITVCWFGKSQLYRVFSPATKPGKDQDRVDCETIDEVRRTLDNLCAGV